MFQLSRFTRLAYGVGHVFNDMCASMWFTYLLVYLQRIAGFSHNQAGLLLFWGQLVDSLCTPVVGYLSDQHVTDNYCSSKQKAWHVLGVLFLILTYHHCLSNPFWILMMLRLAPAFLLLCKYCDGLPQLSPFILDYMSFFLCRNLVFTTN